MNARPTKSDTTHWYVNIEDKITLICDVIVSVLPVCQIYLFGSYVNGGFSPKRKSDLDFYVVVEDEWKESLHNGLVAIEMALWHQLDWSFDKEYFIPTDFLMQRKSRFEELSTVCTLERDIKRRGRLVYDKQGRSAIVAG